MLSGRYNTSSWNQTWGAEFPLYLSSLNPFFPIATNAGLDSAKKFLQVLKRASFSVISPPKFTDFYSLLYLQLDPANIAYLDNTSVVSGCIALLRQYTEDIKSENKGLLSHSFGFYCFRTLVLGIQAGILSCSNDFDTVVETYHYLSNAEHVSAGLAYIVNRAIVQAESIFDVLDPVIVPDTDISIFLRSVGGISNADVDFLLDALWKDRDVMTYLSASYITPGWTCILWVIGQHMIWSLQLERNEKFAWDRYRELCFRRSLFSMPEEFEYLDDVCNELRGFKCFGDTYSGFVVDQADAENILDAYIKWVPSAEIVYPLRLAANFVGYITEDELLKPARPMAEFVGATSQGIWLALQEVDRSMSEDLITYCTGVFECYK
ncbi:hypothetical protein RhiJN_27394 [Ceratobasidium sp. AG-Ba]|nr:hypothetical protein RhiJN_13323 [Ceratobasidium sp. AG-Ba]QRV99375.1 hypothetical protein RhiJN_27394 [Ceratobasidium sp. AG-Ba]QRW13879.1 hypothetical protein RhiLY_12878 [Ceratobasidium sp. AG-Ba]